MIYLDHNASSPPQKKHYKKVFEILEKIDANPSSIHQMGRRAKLSLEESRETIASMLGAQGKNIIFTSGATEANNLALNYLSKSLDNKIIAYSKLDHPSLVEPIKKSLNFNHHSLELNNEGMIDGEKLESFLKEKRLDFASLTYVNGETGIINPVFNLAKKIKSRSPNCHIHVDAVQAIGKLDLTELHNSEVDSASFSAHKIGGLKGIGCLYSSDRLKNKLEAMISGGNQEFGLRSGTENLAGVISFAEACKEVNVKKYNETITPLRDLILETLGKYPEKFVINSLAQKSVCNTLNFHLKNVPIQKVLLTLERHGFLLSTRSACSSGVSGPSPMLEALGIDKIIASSSLRLSLGSKNTEEEVRSLISVLLKLVK